MTLPTVVTISLDYDIYFGPNSSKYSSEISWRSCCFTSNRDVLPKKRLSPVSLSTIVLLTVILTKSKWSVQTNGPDLAGHERATYGD